MTSSGQRLLFIRTFVQLQGGGPIPPVGLLYLASAARRALGGGCEIRLLDTGLGPLTLTRIEKEVRTFSPDVVGLSAMSCEAEWMHEVAAAVKRAAAGCTVVVGGPHAVTAGERILQDPGIDLVVRGEGEVTLVELLFALRAKTPLAEVRGLLLRQRGTVHATPPRPAGGVLVVPLAAG